MLAPSALACQPKTITGNGSSLPSVEPQSGCRFLTARCAGTSNFIVTAYNSSGERVEGLINEICGQDGYYKWEKMWNPNRSKYSNLEVTATGGWSLEIK